MDDPREEEQRRQLGRVLKIANVSVGQLWLRYFGNGGSVGEYEVDAYIQGLISLPVLQRDVLAFALNELVDELPALPRAPLDSQVELQSSTKNEPQQNEPKYSSRNGSEDLPEPQEDDDEE